MRVLAVLFVLGLVVSTQAIPILNDVGGNAASEAEEERFMADEPKQNASATPAPTEAPYTPANSGYRVPCDLTAERGICLFNGAKVLVPDAAPKGLVASYNFNDGHCLDYSHNKLHGATVVPAAPGRGGQGNAARLEGDSYVEVPDHKALHPLASEFTIAFWVFLTEPVAAGAAPADAQCPIAFLGEPEGQSVFQINLNPKTQSLTASVLKGKVTMESNARLSKMRWYHIALTRSKDTLSLYVNGVLDMTAAVAGTASFSRFQFFMGRLPKITNDCQNLPMFVDDLSLYDTAMSRAFIEAQAFPALGGIKPGFIRLGCKNCTFAEAASKCTDNSHLCYENDLIAGALTAARAVGYVKFNTLVHTNDVLDQTQTHKTGPGIPEYALGLCCVE